MDSKHARGRPASGPLTSLFASKTLPQMVALLDRLGALGIEDIARRIGVSRVTVNKEVRKLAELGIVTVTASGTRRLVALTDTPGTRAVRDLAVLACGVPEIIAAEFTGLAGVERVLIYGSWAARNAGERGRLPQDIDVLVVGSADRDEVFDAADRAATRIGIPVSAQRVAPDAWANQDDPFVRAIAGRPMLEVGP